MFSHFGAMLVHFSILNRTAEIDFSRQNLTSVDFDV